MSAPVPADATRTPQDGLQEGAERPVLTERHESAPDAVPRVWWPVDGYTEPF